MRILLDSHNFHLGESVPEKLSDQARAAIIDPENDVFSIASAWELWIKHAKKPIGAIAPVLNAGASGFLSAARDSGMEVLEMTFTTLLLRRSFRNFTAIRSTACSSPKRCGSVLLLSLAILPSDDTREST